MNASNKTILIFDDDPTYGRTMQRYASKMNVEAIVCQTMDEFCLKALEGSYDVALIDFHLEQYKGDDVARIVENRPVVLMSADRMMHKKINHPENIVGYVSKHSPMQTVLIEALKFVA